MWNRGRWIIGALCVLYLAARLWRLSDSCLWFDEIFSVHAAEHDWGGMLRFVAQDLVHPPVFYVVLKVWMVVGGESVFWLRLLPVVFSVMAIVPFLSLCRELKFGMPVAALGLCLIAVNGSLIKYTQTLRMYSMLMFLSLLSMWLFARYFKRGKGWVWLVIVNVLLVYTHYFGWLVIGAETIAILLFQRMKLARTGGMAAIVAAAFAPWIITVWNAARSGSDLGQNIAWQPRPGIGEIATFLLDLVEPFYFQASNVEPGSIYLISVPMLLIVVAGLAVHFAHPRTENETARLRLLLLFALFPAIVGFAISWVMPYSVWGPRHLVMVTPVLAILAANAIIKIDTRWIRIGLIASILSLTAIAAGVASFRDTPKYVWCAWNGVATDIKSKQASPTIYTFENLVAYHLWFATRKQDAVRVKVLTGVDALTADETYFLPRGFGTVETLPIQQLADEEFWLAFRPIRQSDDARLIDNFTRMGYTSCIRNEVGYDRNTVFWLKLAKDPKRCSTPVPTY